MSNSFYQLHKCTYLQCMIDLIQHLGLSCSLSSPKSNKCIMVNKKEMWMIHQNYLPEENMCRIFCSLIFFFIYWKYLFCDCEVQEKYREIPFLIILCKPLTDLLFSNINGLFLVLNNMKHRFWSLKSNKSNLTKGKSINKTSTHKTRITWVVNTWVLMVDNFAKLSSLC